MTDTRWGRMTARDLVMLDRDPTERVARSLYLTRILPSAEWVDGGWSVRSIPADADGPALDVVLTDDGGGPIVWIVAPDGSVQDRHHFVAPDVLRDTLRDIRRWSHAKVRAYASSGVTHG